MNQSEMDTLYSLDQPRLDGGLERFEYAVGRTVCSWFRHEFDSQGGHFAVGRCSCSQVADALWEIDPALAVSELLRAAAAFDQAQAELIDAAEDGGLQDTVVSWPLRRAMHLRRVRLATLDQLVVACDRWPQLAGDPLPGMSTGDLREMVRELIARDYPERRGVPAALERRLIAEL